MAKGKQGFYLEAWKFGVYLLIPIGASWWYSDPERQRQSADYWSYVRYPAHPNTGMRQQIEELAKQQRQREAYREQLMELNRQANESRKAAEEEAGKSLGSGGGRGWLRWIGLGKST